MNKETGFCLMDTLEAPLPCGLGDIPDPPGRDRGSLSIKLVQRIPLVQQGTQSYLLQNRPPERDMPSARSGSWFLLHTLYQDISINAMFLSSCLFVMLPHYFS